MPCAHMEAIRGGCENPEFSHSSSTSSLRLFLDAPSLGRIISYQGRGEEVVLLWEHPLPFLTVTSP